MTEAEKKMKKYVNAVERRLNLPKDVKARVMSDFSSSITARREAGMSDEAIYAELGTPQKAAADLNEQMKEFAYRKSPWRFLFAAAAIYAGMELMGGIWANLVYLWYRLMYHNTLMGVGMTTTESVSIGVIGGADGPTAIFLTTPPWMTYVKVIALLVIGIWGYRRLCKCKQK